MIDLLRGGIPALLVCIGAIAAIRFLCRRPTRGRRSFARSLSAPTGRVALVRVLAPAAAPLLDRVFGLTRGNLAARG